MDRRNFLKGILAASIAPAFIHYANLMKLGYKKTSSGIYIEQEGSSLFWDLTPGDKIHLNSGLINGRFIIREITDSFSRERLFTREMEVVECQSQRDQISLQMCTLNISTTYESPELLTCSELDPSSRKSLVLAVKRPKKS